MTFDERIRRDIDGQAQETVLGCKVEMRACGRNKFTWEMEEEQSKWEPGGENYHLGGRGLADVMAFAQRGIGGYRMEPCFKDAEGQWRIVPQYTRSLDAAMALDRQEWGWQFVKYGNCVEVSIFIDEGNLPTLFSPKVAKVVLGLKFFPNWKEAYAMARTLCALEALGLKIELG